jgi:hypothetical protein
MDSSRFISLTCIVEGNGQFLRRKRREKEERVVRVSLSSGVWRLLMPIGTWYGAKKNTRSLCMFSHLTAIVVTVAVQLVALGVLLSSASHISFSKALQGIDVAGVHNLTECHVLLLHLYHLLLLLLNPYGSVVLHI